MKNIISIIIVIFLMSCEEKEPNVVYIDNKTCGVGTKYLHTKNKVSKQQQIRIKKRIENLDGVVGINFWNSYKSILSFSEYYGCRHHDLAIKMIFKEEIEKEKEDTPEPLEQPNP